MEIRCTKQVVDPENGRVYFLEGVRYEALSREMCESNEELAEYIASHLPISSEDALDFVEGALAGGMFTDKINFSIAIGNRDRLIKHMNSQLNAVRSLVEKHNN